MTAPGRSNSTVVMLGVLVPVLLGAGCEYGDNCCPYEMTVCVRPSFHEGEACDGDWSCVGDLVCWGLPRICHALGEAGDVCFARGNETTCAEGLLCDFNKYCQPCKSSGCGADRDTGTCVFPGSLEIGEACCNDTACASGVCRLALDYHSCMEPGVAGDLCTDDSDCADGLLCHDGLGDTCQPPSAIGGPCAGGDDCDVGLVCHVAIAPATCRLPSELGAPCASTSDCVGPLVCKNLLCDAVAIGDPCDPMAMLSGACGRELHCDIARSVCVELGQLGEACVDSYACAAGLVCNRGQPVPTCEERHARGLGEPCGNDWNCEEGLLCAGHSCTNPGYLHEGEQCNDDIECGEDLRCGFTD